MRKLLLALVLPLAISASCGEEGDECASDGDCGPDAYCSQPICLTAHEGCGLDGSSPCLRRCEPRLEEGDACVPAAYAGPPTTCLEGLTCNAALGVCAPAQVLGGACGAEADCAGEACDPVTSRCIRPGTLGAGDPCLGENACGPDLTCPPANAYAWPPRTCLPALAEGASCAGLPEGCRDDLACRGGVCAR